MRLAIQYLTRTSLRISYVARSRSRNSWLSRRALRSRVSLSASSRESESSASLSAISLIWSSRASFARSAVDIRPLSRVISAVLPPLQPRLASAVWPSSWVIACQGSTATDLAWATNIGSRANNPNIGQPRLPCPLKHGVDAFIRGSAVDTANSEDLVALDEIPLCNVAPGRVQITKTWSDC